jgi:hypothetical protein
MNVKGYKIVLELKFAVQSLQQPHFDSGIRMQEPKFIYILINILKAMGNQPVKSEF